MTVDAKNVRYLGGARGIAALAPGSGSGSGSVEPIPLKLKGYPAVATLATAPDGKLYFVTLEGVVETITPSGRLLASWTERSFPDAYGPLTA